ncbi:MAG TPA: hypothetical protein VNU93_09500 [Verrucomicrobiae bacterium]|nr:hypothetical protein [Verrucomicrobiae bacterium]
MVAPDLLFLAGAVCLGYGAAKQRAFWNMRRTEGSASSPMSRAVSQLVGIAGGIYLSLDLLVTFLSIEIPEKVKTLGLNIDPLAMFSIALAIAQPYLLKVQYFLKRRRI